MQNLFNWLSPAFILSGLLVSLPVAGTAAAGENVFTQTNVPQLLQAVASTNCQAVSVDVTGQVLWASPARNELVVQTVAGALPVKKDLSGQPELLPGRQIRLVGNGTVGQGFLNEALINNDGIHNEQEKSAAIFLDEGMHPIRAGWFNGPANFSLQIQYAGPGLTRQKIPAASLFHRGEAGSADWQPGLNYRCYQGSWERLPHWQSWLPVKAGTATNFDLSVRTRNQLVGLEFSGALQISRAGIYTFWLKSDDGSRLFIGDSALRIQTTDGSSLPVPRVIRPGQPLGTDENYFWATVEGTVTSLHVDPAGGLEVELSQGTNRMYLESEAANFHPPTLFSRIRATGMCYGLPLADGKRIAARLLISATNQMQVISPGSPPVDPPVTTLADLRRLAADGQRISAPLCLTGTVMTAISSAGYFAFQDQTGGMLVQTDPGWPVAAGQQIILTGNGVLEKNRLFLNASPLINNDGIHNRQERMGAAWLHAGRHALHVSWFNRQGGAALEVYYQGPKLARKKIPNDALSRVEIADDQQIKWIQGLNYSSYNGDWQQLPATSRLDPVQTGTTTNYEVRLTKQLEKAGLEFNGFLNVPRAGQYFFTLVSDDGSRLFLDEQPGQIQVVGLTNPPPPLPVVPRQILPPEQNHRWAEVEGTVDFAYEQDGSLYLELNSDYGPMHVEIADETDGSALLLLGSRVKVRGFCQDGLIADGQGIAASLYTPGMKQVELLKIPPAQWDRYPLESVAAATAKITSLSGEIIVHVRGIATVAAAGHSLKLTDATGSVEMEMSQSLPAHLAGEVEVIGRLIRSETNIVVRSGICRPITGQPPEKSSARPLLTTVLQVKQLTREQAQQGYPVKLRGVVTLVRGSGTGFIIQDDTAAIDVWWPLHSNTSRPRVGDYWEVEGKTFAEFAPNINATRSARLGAGAMPPPLHPTLDQLLNGSLDTRYVELQGFVTEINADDNTLTLFTHSGKIRVILPVDTFKAEALPHYQNALVRIRGCVVPVRNQTSQQVEVGVIHLSNATLTVDEPPPENPFLTGRKRVSELLQFDVRAGSLQRVKVSGQILHQRGDEFFLLDDTNALRIRGHDGEHDFQPGDWVEAVGFPELGGASPVLHEAVLRRLMPAALPVPWRIPDDSPFDKKYDGRLVAIEARLVDIGGNWREKTLMLQVRNREFVARLNHAPEALNDLRLGSRLKLTGVYSDLDGGVATLSGLTSFELLLNSPADITVLERPPWWTLQRALIFAGSLLAVVFGGALWIFLLRQQVQEQVTQLAREVRQREHAQQQNLLEKERARIAKDMHDQLGMSVTRVGLLGELIRQNADDREKTAAHAKKICDTAFELGRTLDEIVWAVNPKNDSLGKFCDYIAVLAQELFQLTHTLCRVDLPPEMPDSLLSTEVRHNLFLVIKEALNNVVRHANAGEVWVRFKLETDAFWIVIQDNGQGFDAGSKPSVRNGLLNMKKRMEEIGGGFAVRSEPGKGTEIMLTINLNQIVQKILLPP